MKIIILGAGISGLSAGYHLKKGGFNPTLIEKESEIGGLCRTKQIGKLFFDYGVHVSFTKNPYAKMFFENSVKSEYVEQNIKIRDYWSGFWLNHPPINNLYPLPKPVIKKILLDFIYPNISHDAQNNNYKLWCEYNFGKYFTNKFIELYTKKFWTVRCASLTTDWISDRINKPDLNSVINGIFNLKNKKDHYLTTFRYPKKGGYESYLSDLKNQNVRFNSFPKSIDLKKKIIILNDDDEMVYNSLISTIPLPELISCINFVPKRVITATNKLKFTSLLFLNFKIRGNRHQCHTHWHYYYDREIPYTRLVYISYLGNQRKTLKEIAIQAEIPYSKFKPRKESLDEIILTVIDYISKTEEIPRENIEYLGNIDQKYGYVIFDKNRIHALKIINSFLSRNNILNCGRFGEWDYFWSDQAFLSGKRVADILLKEYGGK